MVAGDRILVPNDSKIVGRVTEVVIHKKGQDTERLGVYFFKIDLKDGGYIPINGYFYGDFKVNRTHFVNRPQSIAVLGINTETDPGPPGLGDRVHLEISPDKSVGPELVCKNCNIVIPANATFVIRNTPKIIH